MCASLSRPFIDESPVKLLKKVGRHRLGFSKGHELEEPSPKVRHVGAIFRRHLVTVVEAVPRPSDSLGSRECGLPTGMVNVAHASSVELSCGLRGRSISQLESFLAAFPNARHFAQFATRGPPGFIRSGRRHLDIPVAVPCGPCKVRRASCSSSLLAASLTARAVSMAGHPQAASSATARARGKGSSGPVAPVSRQGDSNAPRSGALPW